jgi:hypothetical protein
MIDVPSSCGKHGTAERCIAWQALEIADLYAVPDSRPCVCCAELAISWNDGTSFCLLPSLESGSGMGWAGLAERVGVEIRDGPPRPEMLRVT